MSDSESSKEAHHHQVTKPTINPTPKTNPPHMHKTLQKITQHPALTPYRRRVYRVLLSVPPGQWTTYSALAKYLGSSARAVGNAMRTNPFAPDVPCHRVLAVDGSLGGFKGVWERKGSTGIGVAKVRKRKGVEGGLTTREEKIGLLVREGVVFDEDGRAKGTCFGGFVEMGV